MLVQIDIQKLPEEAGLQVLRDTDRGLWKHSQEIQQQISNTRELM